jgi:hypothetical protein
LLIPASPPAITAWRVAIADLKTARFPRAGAATTDASSRLRHAINPGKTAIKFFVGVCRREDFVPTTAKDASMTADPDAIIWPYAPLCVILESAGLTMLF